MARAKVEPHVCTDKFHMLVERVTGNILTFFIHDYRREEHYSFELANPPDIPKLLLPPDNIGYHDNISVRVTITSWERKDMLVRFGLKYPAFSQWEKEVKTSVFQQVCILAYHAPLYIEVDGFMICMMQHNLYESPYSW